MYYGARHVGIIRQSLKNLTNKPKMIRGAAENASTRVLRNKTLHFVMLTHFLIFIAFVAFVALWLFRTKPKVLETSCTVDAIPCARCTSARCALGVGRGPLGGIVPL